MCICRFLSRLNISILFSQRQLRHRQVFNLMLRPAHRSHGGPARVTVCSYSSKLALADGQRAFIVEPASSAGVADSVVAADSPSYLPGTYRLRPQFFPVNTAQSNQTVQHWLQGGSPTFSSLGIPVISDHPSPAASDWSDASVSTLRCKPVGAFVSIIPPEGVENSIHM